ncbi:MAG: hypothetical protein WA364_25465 [Candidatus Nitrosopolaris sp.]
MTTHNRQLKNTIRKGSSSIILQHTEEKQTIIEDWLAERFSDKLRKAARVVQWTRKPRLLYRNTIEESKDVLQEEVCILSRKHIVIMIYAYGGFVSSTFQKIDVYTSDKFIRCIIKEGKKDLLMQCLENLE